MENIQNTFLTKTIPDFLNREIDMKYIKFVFDKDTLKNFINYLDKEDLYSYYGGLRSIEYLYSIRKDMEEGKDGVYIQIHDSGKFFSLLEELIKQYNVLRTHTISHSLKYNYNFIRSIWLRMGPNDVNNVEEFLERQLRFLKNDLILADNHSTVCSLDEDTHLSYHVKNNADWFETNQNMNFVIYKDSKDIFDIQEYRFPSIHYGLAKENNHGKCYIYGIQSLGEPHDEEIKEKLQPIRSSLRNKSISADFIIGMSLFLDFMYEHGIKEIEIPTLQVFNYPYHEQLSDNISDKKQSYDKLQEAGIIDDDNPGYTQIKRMETRFVDKADTISYNKTERFVELFQLIMDKCPNIELISEPLTTSENMIIHLNGKIDILKDYAKKERTK